MQVPDQQLLVRSIRYEAQDIISLELTAPSGAPLTPFSAGSHIDLHLPQGFVRSYSLMNADSCTDRYMIAVYREPNSNGGSRYIHTGLHVGQTLTVSGPRNHFSVADDGDRHVLFAGGIGITPICSMVERLSRLGKEWTLYYCAQTAAKAAFCDELGALAARSRGQVIFNFDGEPGGQMLDISAKVAAEPEDVHFYCCGPKGMLDAFRTACAEHPDSHVHFEYFSADTLAATEKAFTLVLAKSGARLTVPQGSTILQVLLAHGIDIPYSCEQGICGACETKVLRGAPDHRDQILSHDERVSGTTMMICCSGAISHELELDL